MFHIHHVLPQADRFLRHPVVKLLGFDFHSFRNLMALPSNQGLSGALNSSPHTGGHLETYNKAFEQILAELQFDRAFAAAEAGDTAARDRLSAELNNFVATAKYALANGHFLANTPEGMTREDANKRNREWCANWRAYAADNRAQIQQMQDTIEQLYNTGQPARAAFWPALSPISSNLSLADKIDILRRYGAKSPISQQFTTIGPIPELPGFVPPVVDTRLPGFIPPSLGSLNQTEGFARHDPLLTYGLPGFPAIDPLSQGLGQLPPTTAMPQDLQVLQFNPQTGQPLTFLSDGSPVTGPAPSSRLTSYDQAALYGTAAAGALFAAPELLPLLPLWARSGGMGLAGTAAGVPAFAGAEPGGGVFSTGAARYNAFDPGYRIPDSGDHRPGARFGVPAAENKPLDREGVPANTFADRFGNRTETSSGTLPAQTSGAPGMPASGAEEPVAAEDVRRLTRVDSSNSATPFTTGSSPTPYLFPSEFNDRFGDWSISPGDARSHQASRPIGTFADEPGYVISPPIWGLEDPRSTKNDAEEWFARWIRPLMRQD